MNQDGRSSSLTAPNGPAQQAVLRLALADGSFTPSRVTTLEMHGTGTPLGDPIEMGAAAAVLGPNFRQSTTTHSAGFDTHLQMDQMGCNNLVLAAVKAAVGHGEPAAGISGLAHALLQAQQAAAQPILHLMEVNPHVAAIIRQGRMSGWLAPRQLAGMPTPGGHLDHAAGISAFAFQVRSIYASMSREFGHDKSG